MNKKLLLSLAVAALAATKALTAIFIAALIFNSSTLFAQVKVGDNPTTINAGSVMELESTNKGLLMPRVSLTDTKIWGLAGISAAGMHVYNTNTAITSTDVLYPTLVAKKGEYYWDGTGWVALAPVGAQSASVQVSIVKTAANQFITQGVWTKINFSGKDFDKSSNFDLTLDELTIPANGAGYYQFNGNFTSVPVGGAQGAYLFIYVNGASKKLLAVGNSDSGGIATGGSCTLLLNAGDVVDLRMAPTTTNVTIDACNVGVYLISK